MDTHITAKPPGWNLLSWSLLTTVLALTIILTGWTLWHAL